VKLASLRAGGPDGTLVVVDRALTFVKPVPEIAPTLQAALDRWAEVEPQLAACVAAMTANDADALPYDPDTLHSPLPRAYQWLDGSAYVTHVELVRRARGAAMPERFWTDPLMYQGGSDSFLPPTAPIVMDEEDWGIDLEAELAVVTAAVPQGATVAEAGAAIRLLMLVNDVSLRNLIAAELEKGFGFVQSKPSSAFSPVALTPDELGSAWDGGRAHLRLSAYVNDVRIGHPNAGQDMTFDFPTLIAHAAMTRPLAAGTIIGSGTVSNADGQSGSCCLAEVRMLEQLAEGEPQTPFLRFGDRVRIEMTDAEGASLFGAIDQRVTRR
jgi:fumarylacetoacetate (FAA) hydrolase